jgi:hypothetical protein
MISNAPAIADLIDRRFLANPARLARLTAARVLAGSAGADLDPSGPEEIAPLAQRYAQTAIDSLVEQLTNGESEPAVVAAANAILDRGYGKPAVDVGGTGLLPFFGRAPDRNANIEIRDIARRFAELAIDRLSTIAAAGRSESARVAAARSLIDRGLGMVASAKIDGGDLLRPLGKKEQAELNARTASAGGDFEWGDDLLTVQPSVH